MQIFTWLLGCVLAVSVSGAELHFDFGDSEYGSTPTNFQAVLGGGGAPGVWKIISADIPSAFAPVPGGAPVMTHGKVLAQTSEDMTDERYPMFVFNEEKFRDFRFSTQFKIVSGISEQMAGLVFNFENSSNFYVVRVSALGNNVGFYKMIDGQIVSPVKLPLTIPNSVWHRLEVDSSGTYIDCLVDGQKVLPTISDHPPAPGKIGFWTKSDSITYFNGADVDYTPIVLPAQHMVDVVMEKQSRLAGLRIYAMDTNNAVHIIASNVKSEVGQPGTDAELHAIQDGTVFYGREKGINDVTLPLHDRNGNYIGAVRVKTKSLFSESQDTAVTRAMVIQKMVEEYCPNGDELKM